MGQLKSKKYEEIRHKQTQSRIQSFAWHSKSNRKQILMKMAFLWWRQDNEAVGGWGGLKELQGKARIGKKEESGGKTVRTEKEEIKV